MYVVFTTSIYMQLGQVVFLESPQRLRIPNYRKKYVSNCVLISLDCIPIKVSRRLP